MRTLFSKRKTHSFMILFILLFSNIYAHAHSNHVTHEITGGRFGDNLMCYLHAKWISFKFDLPLLYHPFHNSYQLLLHIQEKQYHDCPELQFDKTVFVNNDTLFDQVDTGSTLYVSPYFPESKHELNHSLNGNNKPWTSFSVDWNDNEFIEFVRKQVQPIIPITQYQLPENRISVAIHVRKGGTYDDLATIKGAPGKFLPDSYYISQIQKIHNMLNGAPLFVYIFTDDLSPRKIVRKYSKILSNFDIQFDCRKNSNNDFSNVIDDFFGLMQFDCLIHSESNFSLCAGLLHDYLIRIYPDSYHLTSQGTVIDHINVISNIQ